jgi:hypothetical protein
MIVQMIDRVWSKLMTVSTADKHLMENEPVSQPKERREFWDEVFIN